MNVRWVAVVFAAMADCGMPEQKPEGPSCWSIGPPVDVATGQLDGGELFASCEDVCASEDGECCDVYDGDSPGVVSRLECESPFTPESAEIDSTVRCYCLQPSDE